jgi:hypothetical protein
MAIGGSPSKSQIHRREKGYISVLGLLLSSSAGDLGQNFRRRATEITLKLGSFLST